MRPAKLIPITLPVLLFAVLVSALIYSQNRRGPLVVSGFVEADQIRVGSRVGGRVGKVVAREGQVVKQGDLLLELQPFDLLAQRALAAAERRAAAEELALRRRGFRPEEIAQRKARRDQLAAMHDKLVHGPRPEEVAVARARAKQAAAVLELAAAEHKRAAELEGSQQLSQAQLDKTSRDLRDAEAMVEVTKQELALLLAGSRAEDVAAAKAQLLEAEAALALAQSGFRAEEIAQAEAKLAAQEAALQRIEEQIAELSIRAPVDGTVEALDLRPGDLVGPNAPVLSLMDTRQLWVRAYVPENRMNLAPDQVVEVTVDSFPGKVFRGAITFLARQAEFTPGNVQTPEERSKQVFRIKVTLQQHDGSLRPGMAADVWLEGRAGR
ncbi:MAG: efflux RND transporter periplasmic adaptor subunit [Planctomycetes bacterium]|nr:efflux RND transporter periplasmic adaptor subunit [Planctomycetota bacterium]MCB9869079.1 efflux RND transporter periplasmic adaptor subunit [Planctomycetota bacterium]MCB9888037.1 efflux RND transporter periplasmic adaptor subunit [Planctomycetota bacterium]